MKPFVIAFFLIIFVALQISLSPVMSIKDIAPNLILIFVFFAAFSYGQTYGLWVGFFSGFLCDAFDSAYFGLNMGLFLIVGFAVGSIKTKFYRDNLFVELIIFATTLFLYEIFYSVLIWQFSPGMFFLNIIRYSIPRVIYTSLIACFVFFLFKKIPIFAAGH